MIPDLTDSAEPQVIRALARSCDICGRPRGQPCQNLLGQPLANGHLVHRYRLDKPN